ncbi:MAG: endo-1,4-beta-xylanase [Defluviitaleaceae bacterium]|nr:endo-1,4-beta-xylanase [Defluviitaleaceae bacterium]
MMLPSLAQAFKQHFLLGNIYSISSVMDQSNISEMFLHQFNAVTAENWHKPEKIAPAGFTRPGASDFNFESADTIVDWALENKLTLVGHVLVWHSQSPSWLNLSEPDKPLTRAEAKDNMEFYIKTVAEHFKNRGLLNAFHSWDVVNEAFVSEGGTWGGSLDDWNAGDWKTQMRENSPWYMAYANGCDLAAGEHPSDYIYDAFVFARRYFPHSILYYNDFNEEIPAKRNAIGQMVENLNERWANDFENNQDAISKGEVYAGRMLVEGIGMQSHYHLDQDPTNFDNVCPAIERFIATKALLSITELDITVGGQGTEQHPPTLKAPLDEDDLNRQAKIYAGLFGYYLKFADNIERVSIWGKVDNQSWRDWGHPLLFDKELNAKPAFYAILDVLEKSKK